MAARLRLSPHYGALSRLAAGEGDPSKLSLDVDAKAWQGLHQLCEASQVDSGKCAAAECEEIAAICRHLDLKIEVLPAPPGSAASKRVTATRAADPFEEADAEVKVEPRPAAVSGKVRLEERFGRKPPKPAVEAETLLEKSQLPKLTDFYRALVDAYPGFHVPLAKLLTQNLRAAGVSGLSSSSSDSDSEELRLLMLWESELLAMALYMPHQEKKKKKKKKKKLKKEAKKAEKRKKETEEAEDTNTKEAVGGEGHGKAKKAKGPVKVVDVKSCTAEEVDDELQKELEFEKSRPVGLQHARF
ncbi:HDA18 [Symbiodinium sp. CCMP2592]|nr:HDA18 [Symbiodinium sp. CCMP2592]